MTSIIRPGAVVSAISVCACAYQEVSAKLPVPDLGYVSEEAALMPPNLSTQCLSFSRGETLPESF